MLKELRLAQVVLGTVTGTGGVVIGTTNIAGVTTIVAVSNPVAISLIVVGGVLLSTCLLIANKNSNGSSENGNQSICNNSTVTSYINTGNKTESIIPTKEESLQEISKK